MNKFILIAGGHFIGPFTTRADAESWATKNIDARSFPWRVEELMNPDGY